MIVICQCKAVSTIRPYRDNRTVRRRTCDKCTPRNEVKLKPSMRSQVVLRKRIVLTRV